MQKDGQVSLLGTELAQGTDQIATDLPENFGILLSTFESLLLTYILTISQLAKCLEFDLEFMNLIDENEALNETTSMNTQSLNTEINQDDLGNTLFEFKFFLNLTVSLINGS